MRFRVAHPLVMASLLLAAAGCQREALTPDIQIVGHGGDGFGTYRDGSPPNTMASLRQGYFVEGADAIEMDIQMTADSQLVVFHDVLLDGATTCSGCVSSFNLEELRACRVPGGNLIGQQGHPIPTLDEVLATFGPTNADLYLNIKAHDPCAQADLDSYRKRFARQLSRLLSAKGMHQRCYVESVDLAFLRQMREADGAFRIILDNEDASRAIDLCIQDRFEGFAMTNDIATSLSVQAARDQGLWVVLWNVRVLEATQEAVGKRPNAIMTDDVRMARAALENE